MIEPVQPLQVLQIPVGDLRALKVDPRDIVKSATARRAGSSLGAMTAGGSV